VITNLERSTALPLYLQLSELLIRDIASGRLPDGTRLPPERALAQTHETTVRTLRKALNILEEKGLLERVQGSGNYIRSSTEIDSVYSMFRIELLQGGGLPTAQILTLRMAEKPDFLPPFGHSNRATHIRRLRFLNRIPVALEEIWLDAEAGEIRPERITDSLYHTYRMHLGLRITRAEDYVSIDTVPDWAPPRFGAEPGQTVPFVQRFSHAEGVGTVEYSRNWIDPKTSHYVQRLR
jgi:GntR family transcriptional regulator